MLSTLETFGRAASRQQKVELCMRREHHKAYPALSDHAGEGSLDSSWTPNKQQQECLEL
jgi:hypothetical protein